jgi:DNA-directed RNA polymerase specialized sigma24 family protein
MTAFYQAIEKLPAELRAVFQKRFCEDLSQKQTADQLCVSIDVVKHRFAEGKKLLQSALGSSANPTSTVRQPPRKAGRPHHSEKRK